MRVTGGSWAAIATRLRCHVGTPKSWPSRYPIVWAQLYAAALGERDHDAEAESIRTLRDMLRHKDIRVQREAARELLRASRAGDRKRRAATNDPSPESITHEAIEGFLRAFEVDAEASDATAEPAGDAGSH